MTTLTSKLLPPPPSYSQADMQDAVHAVSHLIRDVVLPHLPSIRALALVIPLFLQGWLLVVHQTNATRLLRKALVPLGIYYAYTITLYDFEPRIPFRAFNFIKNVAFPVGVAKAIELGFVQNRYKWIGYDEAYRSSHAPNGKAKYEAKSTQDRPPQLFSWEALRDTVFLMVSHRGFGWNWGIKGPLIPGPLPQDGFLKSALQVHLRAHILLVCSISAIQYSRFPKYTNNFLEGLGVPNFPGSSYLSDIVVAIVFGTAVWNFLDLAYMEVAIAGYILQETAIEVLPNKWKPAPFDARTWPPLLQNPLRSDSLADWWTFRWHRREFVIVGFKPARYLTKWLGRDVSSLFGVLGAFAASGVLHEVALYIATSELPLDRRLPSMRFFMTQGLGLVVEQIFTRVTGKKVGGWPGRFWLLLVLGFPGSEVTKAWLGRGLINYQPTPEEWEWWRWTIPALIYLPRFEAK